MIRKMIKEYELHRITFKLLKYLRERPCNLVRFTHSVISKIDRGKNILKGTTSGIENKDIENNFER
jgi:hypothetical protein